MKKATTSYMINYVRENVATVLPDLHHFIGDKPFCWDTIDRLFNKELENRNKRCLNDQTIRVEMTLFDLIVEHWKGNGNATHVLHHLNNTFRNLELIVTDDEKTMIFTIIRRLMSTLNLKFYNFLGEIAILNCFLDTKKYHLKKIECRLTNGKFVDFQFQSRNTGVNHLVEVLNIDLKPEKVQDNPDLINKFLQKRIDDKLTDKVLSLETPPNIVIAPILWGEAAYLKIYSNYFKIYRAILPGSIEPFAYLSIWREKRKFETRFLRISNLFD
jgi:hypothetical protein